MDGMSWRGWSEVTSPVTPAARGMRLIRPPIDFPATKGKPQKARSRGIRTQGSKESERQLKMEDNQLGQGTSNLPHGIDILTQAIVLTNLKRDSTREETISKKTKPTGGGEKPLRGRRLETRMGFVQFVPRYRYERGRSGRASFLEGPECWVVGTSKGSGGEENALVRRISRWARRCSPLKLTAWRLGAERASSIPSTSSLDSSSLAEDCMRERRGEES